MNTLNMDKSYSQITNSYPINYNTSQPDIPKPDIRKEMILYFYSAMLQSITTTKEIIIKESVMSIPSAEKILIGQNFVPTTRRPTYESEEEILSRSRRIDTLRKKRSFLKRRQDRAPKTRKTLMNIPGIGISSDSLADRPNISLLNNLSEDNWMLEHTEENVKIKFTNGNTYIGTTFCNMLHGEGKYIWSNGTIYEGEFKNNEITGKGCFKYPDQSVYSGEVYKNYCHGSGLLNLSMSPSIYKGTFKLNVKHGCGWQLFSNNNMYQGEWVDGQMTGQGYRKYSSGAEYSGKFLMGKRHGYGVAVLKNHDVYAGDWVQGERHGFGDYIWNVENEHYFSVPVQSCYYGSWVNNKRDGIGLINFGMEGGSRYAGYFANNEKHGSGVIICENGHVIDSNPLFINDKPVHVTDSGNMELLPNINSPINFDYNEDESLQVSRSNETCTEDTNETRQERLLKRFPLGGKLAYGTPSSERSSIDICKSFKQNANNSDVYNTIFPKFMDQYSSLNIRIGVSSELIDLDTHIYKIIEYKSSVYDTYQLKDGNETEFLLHSSSVETYSDYELHKFEEKQIRKSISKYLRQLKRIYNQYAKIGCMEKETTFQPWLMRIFFWQLYRDCKIPEKGISLIDIDLMFSEKSTFDAYVVHNPFEVIYFCQYLENLLHVALTLYGKVFISSDDGVLKQSFEYLMENDILPNSGHFKGSVLFEYRDVIPLKAAYAWYKKFGEPHTIKQFYSNIYKVDNIKHSKYYTEFRNGPYIQNGHNVINCGNKLFYFTEDENTSFSNQLYKEKIEAIQHENMNKLYFLANLKKKHIAKHIYSICPMTKNHKDIINFEYKLSFLEFYEIILLCIQEKVKIKNRRPRTLLRNTIIPFAKKKKKSITPRKSKKAQG